MGGTRTVGRTERALDVTRAECHISRQEIATGAITRLSSSTEATKGAESEPEPGVLMDLSFDTDHA